jgi:diadenosine tetraphosphate (Ap4A) HIT family hydrolase
MVIFENSYIRVEKHDSPLPWVKIFSTFPYKELTECDKKTRKHLFKAALLCEKEMIKYYSPTKINHASFGNYLPHVHLHVMARFEDDSHFPESLWGVAQREGKLDLPPFDIFASKLFLRLQKKLNH